jgi:chaperonin cofactor prefoldin
MVKMDPATIGLLISIAPTVLDLLFGQGHIKESFRQQRYPLENMYGYGLEGYGMYGQGYRYPRRKRRLTVESYFSPEVQPQLIRAAVFNRAIAKKNPWLTFLHDKDYFNRIRTILKEAAAEYRKTNPVTQKQRKNLERQSTRLQAELNILQNELQNKTLGQEFGEDYPGLNYTELIQGKINKLQSELNRVNNYLQALQSPQVLVPKK